MIQDRQVALRIDSTTLKLLKARAKMQNRSFNNYILCLCQKDLNEAGIFPKVALEEIADDDIRRMAGDGTKAPSQKELAEDERLREIWKR